MTCGCDGAMTRTRMRTEKEPRPAAPRPRAAVSRSKCGQWPCGCAVGCVFDSSVRSLLCPSPSMRACVTRMWMRARGPRGHGTCAVHSRGHSPEAHNWATRCASRHARRDGTAWRPMQGQRLRPRRCVCACPTTRQIPKLSSSYRRVFTSLTWLATASLGCCLQLLRCPLSGQRRRLILCLGTLGARAPTPRAPRSPGVDHRRAASC